MKSLSTCPRCLRMVTLPDSADAAARVRCPLCNVEYLLSEALALVPPALIVVSATDRPATPSEASAATTGLTTAPFFVSGPTVTPPTEDSESAADAAEAASAGDLRDDFALDFAEHLAESESQSDEGDESAEIDDAALPGREFSAVTDKPALGSELEKAPASVGDKGAPQAKPLLKTIALPRKRKKKGPIRLLGELILGGGMGLVIAYYGVWWIRGESADLPRVEWLPGLPPAGYGAITPSKPIPEPDKRKAESRTDKPAAEPESTVVSRPSTVEKTAAPANLEPQAAVSPGEKTAPDSAKEKVPLPAKKQPPPPPKIGPHPPAEFDFFALDNALQEATDAFFAAGSVEEKNYPALCRLAEVRTYIAADKLSLPQRKTVQDFLDHLAQDSQRVAEIERLGGAALKKASEETSKTDAGTTAADESKPAADAAQPGGHLGGILLAGKAAAINSQKGLQGATIKLAEGGGHVFVFSAKPFDFVVGDNVLLAGGMIANPDKNLAGYAGSARLAIWLGTAIRIPAADADKK
ncbi:MAG: hypothetical protein IT426_16155 [Pirellulales bacterium]|nr:hypothetical protein [Pirellulales bacterium]